MVAVDVDVAGVRYEEERVPSVGRFHIGSSLEGVVLSLVFQVSS